MVNVFPILFSLFLRISVGVLESKEIPRLFYTLYGAKSGDRG